MSLNLSFTSKHNHFITSDLVCMF